MSLEPEVTAPLTPNKPAKKSLPWRGIGIFCSTIAVLALIIGSYYAFYSLTQSQAQLAAAVMQLQHAQQQNNVEAITATLDTAQQSIQHMQTDIADVQEGLKQLTASQQNNHAFEIAQARYDVKLAYDNVQYGNNIALAIALLKQADSIVATMADEKYDALRKALASDIASLESLPSVDVSGAYMRLIALDNQVQKLPFLNAITTTGQPAPAQTASTVTGWRQGLAATWQALQKIVVVRYHPDGTLPLVRPDEQQFLYQNIHAMLMQSIWALLHHQQTVYQTSLQQTALWVKNYFVSDSPVTAAFVNELDQLQQLNIQPTLPTLTDSLQAFAALQS